jgi:hypothetical protein
MRDRLAVLLAVVCLVGCAGLEMRNIASEEDDKSAQGFRYYDTSPFLLVYTDSKGGIKSEVLYLPDTEKKRSIRPYAYGAKNDATFKFQNGVMVGTKATVDETIIPVAAISALEKVATSLVKAANAGTDEIPAPRLFRIFYDGTTWKLAGEKTLNAQGNTPATIKYAKP